MKSLWIRCRRKKNVLRPEYWDSLIWRGGRQGESVRGDQEAESLSKKGTKEVVNLRPGAKSLKKEGGIKSVQYTYS